MFRELSPKILAELLIPNPKATNRRFDLTVDQWKFLGHSKSCTSSQLMFNVVFVVKVETVVGLGCGDIVEYCVGFS